MKHAPQIRCELLPPARIGAIELQVHHGFAAMLVTAQRFDELQFAMFVAINANDGVKKAMDGQLAGGNGVGDRVDEERHVVVDDGDPHPAPAGFATCRFDLEAELATFPPGSDFGDELGGVALPILREALRFAWKSVSGQRLSDRLDQRRVQARVCRHAEILLRRSLVIGRAYRPAVRERTTPLLFVAPVIVP
jgi:hypothetical protein